MTERSNIKAKCVRRSQVIVAAFGLFVGSVGCANVSVDARDAQLVNWLVEDNRPLLEREPELTAMKFQKMAGSLYGYLRGTASIFVRDLMEPGAFPSRFATHASSQVLVIGDAHPENIGSYRTEDGTLLIAFNDFDGAGYGPWHFEVRRLALAYAAAGIETLRANDAAAIAKAAALGESVADGYVAEIQALLQGEAPTEIRRGQPAGQVFNEVFKRANEDGPQRVELKDFTIIEDGRRVLREGALRIPVDGYYSRELWPVSLDERRLIDTLLRQWVETTNTDAAARFHGAPILSVRRRIGMGVGSFPLLRYYVLLQGPSGDVDDVYLLDLKEARDAVAYPGVVVYPGRAFANNAERSVTLQREFQEFVDCDPMLGWGAVGALAFRVQSVTDYQKDNDVARLSATVRAGEWTWADVEYVASLSGRLLARSHALALTAQKRPGLDVIEEALHNDFDGFVDETRDFTRAYLPILIDDHARFQRLVASEGTSLGYRPSSTQAGE